MIYLPIRQLRPGMILARDISSDSSFFSLLAAGQALTSDSIVKLVGYGVWGAYIQSDFCSDITLPEPIDREFKHRAMRDIKKVYDGYSRRKSVSALMVRQVSDLAKQLLEQVLSREELLVSVVDIKEHDTYTYSHSIYVGILSVLIGIQLGYASPALSELAMCGLLHDIGKLDISLDIINKPSSLTDEEFEIIKTHPAKAIDRLDNNYHVSARVLSGISTHHEKYDGSGYPRGLIGSKIPIYGRILALADVFDSLTSNRPYRAAWSSNETIEYMLSCTGSHFDSDLLEVFLRTVSAYPPGTIVQLSDGGSAVVLRNSPDNMTRPVLRMLTPDDRCGQEVDLSGDPAFLSVTISSVCSEGVLPDILIKKASAKTEAVTTEAGA